MDERPPTLPYANQPNVRPRIPFLFTKFFLGLIGGCALTGTVVLLASKFDSPYTLYFLVTPLILKAAFGTALTIRRSSRPVGVGLLTSIPAVVLLVFVGCAMAISSHM